MRPGTSKWDAHFDAYWEKQGLSASGIIRHTAKLAYIAGMEAGRAAFEKPTTPKRRRRNV